MLSDVTAAGRQTHACGCVCPACGGLECLERPRFFAGQLLTEAELNSDQAYVLAKNRLHNRYLHGPGVVCGLEVACDACDGWVSIAPGYAIDPCGNDIVLCQEQRLNVLDLIASCRDTCGSQVSPCDPVRDNSSGLGDCRGMEEHWCVTVAYEEREARPTTVLRREPSSGTCQCGSNGKTNGNGGCGCGCGGKTTTAGSGMRYSSSATATATASARQASALTMGACEPTRIVEAFRLDVCEGHAGLCRTPEEAIKGSLLWEMVGCVSELYAFGQRRVPESSYQPLLGALFAREATGSPRELFNAYCYLRQALYELGARNPLKVRCNLSATLDQIVLQSPPNDEDETYANQAQVAIQGLAAVVWQYVVDCVCQRLLPPCPPAPIDDRLILACVTIVDGKIVDICNFGCRTYAGSWPQLYRWASLVPVLPLLGVLVDYLCCMDWITPDRGKEGNRVMAGIDRVDPTYKRASMYESNFSQVRDLVTRIQRVRGNLTLPNLPTAMSDPKAFGEIVRSAFQNKG